jgi:hypothetical protein
LTMPIQAQSTPSDEANWLLLLPAYTYGDTQVRVRWPGGRAPENADGLKKVDVIFSVGGSGGFPLPI